MKRNTFIKSLLTLILTPKVIGEMNIDTNYTQGVDPWANKEYSTSAVIRSKGTIQFLTKRNRLICVYKSNQY